MTRLAVAAAVFAAGLVGYVTQTDQPGDTPTVTPTVHRHRPVLSRASRGMRRAPLPSASTRVHGGKARRPESSRDLRRGQTQTWQVLAVTAYCATGNRNAAGNWPTIGTAAANAYPLGTRLDVENVGVVTVEDRSAPGATDVDIYLGDGPDCVAAATDFGRRMLRVSVIS